jgi:hypothetical protein
MADAPYTGERKQHDISTIPSRWTCQTGAIFLIFCTARTFMRRKESSLASNTQIDWDNPKLVSLLQRSEQWSIDNRGGFSPQSVEVYFGWSGSVGKTATLVWERENAVVLETTFPIGQGEQVRVDKHLGDRIRTLWGVVVDGREGAREEDRENGIHIYWLQLLNKHR